MYIHGLNELECRVNNVGLGARVLFPSDQIRKKKETSQKRRSPFFCSFFSDREKASP